VAAAAQGTVRAPRLGPSGGLRSGFRARGRWFSQTVVMEYRRCVFLDPDGTMGAIVPWMYVVVEMETGVVYQQQCGGTATRQGEVEGYLVPVHAPDSPARLRDLFERALRGAGAWDYDWPAHQLAQLRGGWRCPLLGGGWRKGAATSVDLGR
jgi:hypothetical protein